MARLDDKSNVRYISAGPRCLRGGQDPPKAAGTTVAGRPKASEARDTRAEILDVALELFADKGFYGVSIREVARGSA